MQQPFAVVQKGQTQLVDPLHADVLELMGRRRPYYLTVPLVWPAPRTIGNSTSNVTQERKFNLLVIGARSILNFSKMRLRNETTDIYYSNDFIPFYAMTGGSGSDRQAWEWHSWIYLPSNTQLVVEATLGPTLPGGGIAEADSEIVFECVVIS